MCSNKSVKTGWGWFTRRGSGGLGRVVALKLMLAGSRATEAEIKRFQTEAKAAATLKHPNVVAIHEVGEHHGQQYFSMDYIEGRSLAEVIRRAPLPAARAARYVKIIAEAYLDPEVRASISGFSRIDPGETAALVERLRRDLETGEWERRFGHLRSFSELDLGYRLVVAGIGGHA